jgi:competence protein ComQ
MEKEAVQMKMREIIETSFSVPSLKEAILTLIEDQAKQSHFLFGRLASLHMRCSPKT